MLASRFCVVYRLPSAIRLGEYIVPDAFGACAERLYGEMLRYPNTMVSAIILGLKGQRAAPGIVGGRDVAHRGLWERGLLNALSAGDRP